MVTVKTTVTLDDDTTDVDESATNPQESEASRIDVVGPQTLTDGFEYTLPLDVAYTVDEETSRMDVLVVESVDDGLKFDPKDATDADDPVTVGVSQEISGETLSHTFPVTILEASSAPSIVSDIPDRRIVKQQRTKALGRIRVLQG